MPSTSTLSNKGAFMLLLAVTTLSLISSGLATNEVFRPHIIFILADDLGWNDIGFHGSAQISTPNIDALAYSGLILNQYYVNPICTPSRSALMTGKYPIHTGMQHTVLYGAEPRGLPLTEKILPQYLNDLGYSSHIVGKWHLGHYKHAYTPLYRGFQTHVGFWTGHHDYFDHTAVENPSWGLDIRRGLDISYDLHGKYTTDIVTDESMSIIRHHNVTKPLFLYVAHAAVHSGNPYNPLPAPDATVAKMGYINDFNRRKFAAMVSKLDDSVGSIVAELQNRNMLKNSIIVFSTDNGGPANGFNLNHASNWPLRGVKNTLWEGGVRGVGLIWSPFLNHTGRIANQMFQVADWLPTLYHAAGGDSNDMDPKLDGINIWEALSNDSLSPRKAILHNIDDIWGSSSVTVGDWKVIKGTNYQGAWDGWYGPAGLRNESSYNINTVLSSPAGKAIISSNMMPSEDDIRKLRASATVDCNQFTKYLEKSENCEPLKSACLFNIREDPCERFNLATKYPKILKFLLIELDKYNETAIPPGNLPLDPRADPRFWDYTWTNFGDYSFQRQLPLHIILPSVIWSLFLLYLIYIYFCNGKSKKDSSIDGVSLRVINHN